MTASFLHQVQELWLSQAISHSTWGYPIVSAVHVLAMTLFAGTVLVTDLRILGVTTELRGWRWIGFLIVALTGILLFIANPVRYSASAFFRLKMLLLFLSGANAVLFPRARLAAYLSLILWITVIFASRGIAFF
jgi:hypothetical protein